MGRSQDHISNLPEEILHHILSFLSPKSSVRTCILSKRWRYLWTFYPNLDFSLKSHSYESKESYVLFIDHFLRFFSPTKLRRFKVHIFLGRSYSPNVQDWIDFAKKRSVQDLELNFHPVGRQPFELPCILFHCQSISSLKLIRCVLNPPSNFVGFGCLNALHLTQVQLTDEIVSTLLTKCPHLETLKIMSCISLVNLKISAPNLKNLTVSGMYRLVSMELYAPDLVSFDFEGSAFKCILKNIVRLHEAKLEFLHWIPGRNFLEWRRQITDLEHVKVLSLSNCLLKLMLSEYYILGRVSISFENLKELHLNVSICGYKSMLLALVAFIQDCPYLEKVCVNLAFEHEKGEENFFCLVSKDAEQPYSNQVLCCLKTFQVNQFSGDQYEMQMAKLILEKAIILDSLILTFPLEWDNWDEEIDSHKESIRRQVSLLPKASPHAQIAFLELPKDDDFDEDSDFTEDGDFSEDEDF